MTGHSYDHEGNLVGSSQSGNLGQPPQEESLEALLQRTESELNGHYPMMVDSATRLDSVTAEGRILRYNYSLLNASVDELDVDATRAALKPLVEQQATGMAFLKQLLDRGATIVFSYKDKDGQEITAIDVNKDQA